MNYALFLYWQQQGFTQCTVHFIAAASIQAWKVFKFYFMTTQIKDPVDFLGILLAL